MGVAGRGDTVISLWPVFLSIAQFGANFLSQEWSWFMDLGEILFFFATAACIIRCKEMIICLNQEAVGLFIYALAKLVLK